MLAHSDKLVLPTMTAPAARSRATRGASRLVTFWARARLPAVVGSGPRLSILSLISTGIPNSGPRAPARSSAFACSIAVGSVAITALTRGFSALIRFSAALVLALAEAAEVKPGRSAPAAAVESSRTDKARMAGRMDSLLASGDRLQQGVERALAAGGRLQPGVAQAPMPIELGGSEGIAALHEQAHRLLRFRRGGDGALQPVAVEGAAVHRQDLGADRQPRVEGGRVPDDARHAAVASADGEAARIAQVHRLRLLLAGFEPIGRRVGIDQLVAALGDAFERR